MQSVQLPQPCLQLQLDTEGTCAEVPALGRAAATVEVIVHPLLALHWLIKAGLDVAFSGHSHTLCWDTGVL